MYAIQLHLEVWKLLLVLIKEDDPIRATWP